MATDKKDRLRNLMTTQAEASRVPRIERREWSSDLGGPLSCAQQSIWYAAQIDAPDPAYNNSIIIRISGALDVEVLNRSLSFLLQRHESLRTRFVEFGGVPSQFCEEVEEVQLALQQISAAEAEAVFLAEARHSFMIDRDRLFQAKLFHQSDERFVLVVSMHHLISDAWSMGLFLREMVALYDAYSSGREISLNALPVTYLDYVYWERDWLDSGVLERQLKYWQHQLKDLAQPPMVPQDLPPASSRPGRGGTVGFAVPDQLLHQLKSLGHDHNCSLFVTLLAGFAVVLHRYSSESDIAIGTGVSNRPSTELEGLVGCFVNTLILRFVLPPERPFIAMLKTAREVLLQALTHKDAPYQRVVEQLPQKRAGDVRLFQAIFTFQNVAWQQRVELPSVTMEVQLPSSGAAKFDLFISVQEWPEGLRGQIEYRCDLYKETTVRRLADHYLRALHHIVEQPEARIREISILSRQERQQLLEEWSHGERRGVQASVTKLFEAQAEICPDSTAVVFEDAALSYRELNRRANQLAHYLHGLGVGPDKRVGICAERGLEAATGILAILKAGGAYVPLDPKYPLERLSYVFEDSTPEVVLAQGHLRGILEAISKDVPVVDLTAAEPEWLDRPDANPRDVDIGLSAEHLAYVIYTSGSSGLPKGVEVSHRGMWDLVRSQIRAFGIRSEDRVLQFASMNFDASVPEIFTAWLTGASLHLAAQDQLLPGRPLGELLKEREITVLTLPPSLLGYLKKEDAASLQVLIVAGEACSQKLVEEWAPGRRMFNAYGPTEVTVCATLGQCRTGDEAVHIGRPIEGASVYLLDRYLEPVPQGVTGEIYVGGAGVARGYLRLPELTAERFVGDPFTGTQGARMYKTGDLGRWRADATIEFQGRNDWQVKIRGHRIELEEIEACLLQHAGVRQAVVVAREETAGDKRLVAYVVPRPIQGVEMWPSVAEYYIYDDLLYYAMTNDQRRNDAYRTGMKNLKGAVVLEIGTGPEALLARLCVESGARKVYAVELLQSSYEKACARVAELGLQDKIEVIHGDVTKIRLPELVDACVSEIVGPIGGSEGAAQILNRTRHLFKSGARVIPRRSITRMAAVRLPETFVQQPAFSEIGATYVEKVFSAVGYRFDTRVCLKGIGYDDLVSDWGVFEDLDYTQEVPLETEHDVVLTVKRDGTVHGLLVWLTLEVGEGEWLDILAHEHCWIPVYLPVFGGGMEMRAGELIHIRLRRALSENGLNPDFHIAGRVGMREFLYSSPHVQREYKSTPFYERLWSGDAIPVRPTQIVDKHDLSMHLQAALPEYMVPAVFVSLTELPLTPNGKVDRKALPAPDEGPGSASGYDPPQGEVEITLARLWMEVLNCDCVGRHDNFFELGGHSLLAVTLIERMHRHNFKVDVHELFVTPTLAELAASLDRAAPTLEIPPNRILPDCDLITPEMLPLIELTQEEIDRIVATVPGGAANVQDIYPLAPLQEGILFHHLMGGDGDPYVVGSLFSFENRVRLESYVEALQGVVNRHDILRTAVLWEGVPEPVQVVWRRAPLPMEEIELDPAAGDASEQFYARFNPRRFRIDVRRAPMLLLYTAWDRPNQRWLLMILMHHLAGDHTTLEVMQMEIKEHLLGQQASLPPAMPLRNMVVHARLGVSREEHEAFFRKMLADVDEPTAPFGVLEVEGDGSGIEQAELPLEDDLAARLREQARRLGVSVASLCHVAWGRVLSKLAGREDVVFGTVLFGRMQGWEGADRVMGLFINTLPVRLSAGKEGVENAVRNTQLLLADLMLHEHAPLALAQRCSAVSARTPLFSSLLNYRYSAGSMLESFNQAGPAWEGIRLVRSEQRTNYPLILSVDDLGEGFLLETQSQGSMGSLRICVYMRTALESLVAALESAPETEVRCIEVLPPSERCQLIEQWNATVSQYPSGKCIHHLFEQQVQRTPEEVALVFEDQTVTYEELNRSANQLAHYLYQSGVRPEERVGICVERGPDMVVGMLAVMKAGAAYIPLDPAYPEERLRFMVEDSEPAALLTYGKFQALFAGIKGSSLVIDVREPGLWKRQPETNPEIGNIGLSPEHPVYVIYTSGSTGRPKGVSMPHRSVVNLLWWQMHRAGSPTPKRTLQFAAIGFDVAFQETFLTLCSGGALVLIDEGKKRNFTELVHVMDATGVQRLFLPFVALQMLAESLNEMHASGQGNRFGGTLSEVITAGEQLRVDPKITGMFDLLRGCTLENQYGPTEAHVVTSFPLPADTSRWALLPPIGRPIANARMYVLDQHLEPVPVGVVGELYIGGEQIARGYWKRPDLTAERFVSDPFTAAAGTRMYKTGDQARWLADGTIEFLGRNDFQVKVRGFRIELGEIEARLAEHPKIAKAVVMAKESAPGEKRLVAYYTAVGEKQQDMTPDGIGVEQLRAYLAAKLPDYMVPAAYVQLEKMPMTPNGKLDRKALPSPEGDAYGARSYEAPIGETETTLATILTQLLKVKRVGRHDNFFDLGGHSLLAMRVISRVRQTLDVEIALSELFAFPEVSLLADRITEMQLAQFDPEEIARLEKQMRSS